MKTLTNTSKQVSIALALVLAVCVDTGTVMAQQTSHSSTYDALPDTAMQSYVKSQMHIIETNDENQSNTELNTDKNWVFSNRGLNIKSNWLP